MTADQLERLRFAVADAAYDTHRVYDSFAELGAQPIAVPNPRKDAELKGPLARSTRRELRERDGIGLGIGIGGSCSTTANEDGSSIESGSSWIRSLGN